MPDHKIITNRLHNPLLMYNSHTPSKHPIKMSRHSQNYPIVRIKQDIPCPLAQLVKHKDAKQKQFSCPLLCYRRTGHQLGISSLTLLSTISAIATLLVTPKSGCSVEHVVAVDPNSTGLNSGTETVQF